MTELWVEREGVRRYTGRSSRGAQVAVGSEDVDGVFTPGELLKIALAACSAMSSDAPLARRLGDDYPVTVSVSGPADRTEERYPHLRERMDLGPALARAGLAPEEVRRLLVVVARAVDSVCPVGRTLAAGAEVDFEMDTGDTEPGEIAAEGEPQR